MLLKAVRLPHPHAEVAGSSLSQLLPSFTTPPRRASVELSMRAEKTRNVTPKSLAGSAESATRKTTAGDEASFDWGALVPCVVHPAKVAMVEAIAWIGEPLSASQLAKILTGSGWPVQLISYHAKVLAGWGALEKVEERQVKGVIEKAYYFASAGSGSP